MVRDVYLYRHAQAEHNATSNWWLPDPALTDLGRAQARDIPTTFSEQFPDALVPTPMLVASPLRRTIETSLLGFGGLPKPVFMAELQEINNLPCDTGSPPAHLMSLFPQLDFTGLAEDWTSKQGRWAPQEAALAERARVARKWLRDQPGHAVVVVSHGDFLRHYLAVRPGGESEDHWENAEGRLYHFKDGHESQDEHAWLVRVTAPARVDEGQKDSQTSGEMAEGK